MSHEFVDYSGNALNDLSQQLAKAVDGAFYPEIELHARIYNMTLQQKQRLLEYLDFFEYDTI